jgi:hypothetical protein
MCEGVSIELNGPLIMMGKNNPNHLSMYCLQAHRHPSYFQSFMIAALGYHLFNWINEKDYFKAQ